MKYHDSYYYEHAHSLLINDETKNCTLDLSQIDRLNSTLHIIPSDVKLIIDIGSHCGTFLNMLKTKNTILAFGLERSSVALDIARNQYKITLVRGDAGALPFGNNAADAVCALQVIEHLPYNIYNTALNEMERVARKYVIISIPFKENRWYVYCPYCGCRFSVWYHFHTYNHEDIVSLFKNFHLKTVCYVNPKIELVGWNMLRNIYRLLKHRFPASAVCPACGYNKSDCRSKIDTPKKLFNFMRSKWFPIPKKRIYVRAICLYERHSQI